MSVISECRKRRKFRLAGSELRAASLLLFFMVTVGFLALLPPEVRLFWRRSTSGMRNRYPGQSIKKYAYGTELSGKGQDTQVLPLAQGTVEGYPAFFRDTKLNLNVRSYYFYRDSTTTARVKPGLAVHSRTNRWFLDRFSWDPPSTRPGTHRAG